MLHDEFFFAYNYLWVVSGPSLLIESIDSMIHGSNRVVATKLFTLGIGSSTA